MFFLPDPHIPRNDELVLSASDIVAGSTCEFAAVRKLDVLLKRLPPVTPEADPMGDLTAALGDKHEARVLGLLREEFGPSRVYEVGPPRTFDRPGLVRTCSVIGFPLGATPGRVKEYEARCAVNDGADEIDMVIDMAAARADDKHGLMSEITAVAEAVHAGGGLLKVIIETSLLSYEQKIVACEASVEAGADFVKTSTGFNGGGATVDDILLMRGTVGPDIGVKASGGIRSLADAKAVIAAGATRIGTSSGVAIVTGEQGSSVY